MVAAPRHYELEGVEEDEETLLDVLVKFTQGEHATATHVRGYDYIRVADPKILHDEVLNILIAGRDTVGQP